VIKLFKKRGKGAGTPPLLTPFSPYSLALLATPTTSCSHPLNSLFALSPTPLLPLSTPPHFPPPPPYHHIFPYLQSTPPPLPLLPFPPLFASLFRFLPSHPSIYLPPLFSIPDPPPFPYRIPPSPSPPTPPNLAPSFIVQPLNLTILPPHTPLPLTPTSCITPSYLAHHLPLPHAVSPSCRFSRIEVGPDIWANSIRALSSSRNGFTNSGCVVATAVHGE